MAVITSQKICFHHIKNRIPCLPQAKCRPFVLFVSACLSERKHILRRKRCTVRLMLPLFEQCAVLRHQSLAHNTMRGRFLCFRAFSFRRLPPAVYTLSTSQIKRHIHTQRNAVRSLFCVRRPYKYIFDKILLLQLHPYVAVQTAIGHIVNHKPERRLV